MQTASAISYGILGNGTRHTGSLVGPNAGINVIGIVLAAGFAGLIQGSCSSKDGGRQQLPSLKWTSLLLSQYAGE
jgi:hypothetical protein